MFLAAACSFRFRDLVSFFLLFIFMPTFSFALFGKETAKKDLVFSLADVSKKLSVRVEKSPCLENGELKFEVQSQEDSHSLICQKEGGTATIRVTKNVKYPDSILADLKILGYNELDVKKHSPVQKTIGTVAHSWGTEYFWVTPTEKTVFHVYVCPKKNSTCYKIVHSKQHLFNFALID